MKLFVNGKEIEVPAVAMEKRIVEFLREDLDLTGAKNACDIGACGACTILVNDEPIRICIKRVKDFAGQKILTIEGLAAPDGTLHPLQQAFVDCGAIQCGYCTPGMVLTAHAFLLKNPRPTREEIRHAIFQNLCRCTGYQQIIDAVEKAAPHYRSVASGVSPDVENGILPSGIASDISKRSKLATTFPPGRMPGSTAGRRPAAT
jgi:carbon-monoxide dehydrogenase small subunit